MEIASEIALNLLMDKMKVVQRGMERSMLGITLQNKKEMSG